MDFNRLPLSITSRLQGLKDSLTSDTSTVSQFFRPSTFQEARKVDPRQDPIVGKAISGFEQSQRFAQSLPGIKQFNQGAQYFAPPENETPFEKSMRHALDITPVGIAGRVEQKISKELARKLVAEGGTEELVGKLSGKAKVMGQLILDGLKRIKDPTDQMELGGILHEGIARGFTPESEKKALNVLRAYPTDPVSQESILRREWTKTGADIGFKQEPLNQQLVKAHERAGVPVKEYQRLSKPSSLKEIFDNSLYNKERQSVLDKGIPLKGGKIKVWRATNLGGIKENDFVALTKEGAEKFADGRKVISQEVDAKDVKSWGGQYVLSKPSSPLAQERKMYHVTSAENAEAIRSSGFKPQIGERSMGVANAKGTWLYEDASPTGEFGKNFSRVGKKPEVVEANVQGKIYDAINDDRSIRALVEDKKLLAKLKSEGYVGIRGDELGTPATFVFEPSALKVSPTLAQEVGKDIYHATSEDYASNMRSRGVRNDLKKLYFASNEGTAKGYGKGIIAIPEKEFKLLDIRSAEGQKFGFDPDFPNLSDEMINKLRSSGFDGIKYQTDKTNFDYEIFNKEKLNKLIKR